MHDLTLFAKYLVRARQDRLQASHQQMVAARTPEQMAAACVTAHEAELCTKMSAALADLEKDPGQFVERYLK